jgi:integrase
VIEGLRVAGKRKRLFFRTRAEAELELARIKLKRAREGEDALAIPDSLRIMARDCAALLAPHDKTLAQATAFYLDHLEKLRRSISVADLVSEYQLSKGRANLCKVHIRALDYRLGRFVRDFGAEPVRTLGPETIEDWLHGLELGPMSYNNFRSRLSALFSYGCARHYLDSNPIEAVARVKVVAAPPKIFTTEGLEAVLSVVEPGLLPVVVIGAFCGLRAAELLRLDWNDINLRAGYVHVTAAKAKTARRRLVPISDNLREWLVPYTGRTGKVCSLLPQYYHAACSRAAREAGLDCWPKNGLRHSYCSYWLSQHKNAAELALHMGHTGSALIFEFYRELVTADDAARYWQIRPRSTPANVIALSKASA